MLLVEQIERQVLADRQVAASLRAAGAEIDLPEFTDARARFDAALEEEPRRVTPADAHLLKLRRALGVT